MVIEGKQVKEWVERAYNNAVKHGWHEEKKPTAHWVMMISTEVTEAVQADRKGRWMDDLDKSGLDCVIANDHHGGLVKNSTANILRELLRVNWQTSAFVYLTLWG